MSLPHPAPAHPPLCPVPLLPPPPPLQAVNWLRRQWSEGNNAALADERGLGKSAAALAFLRGLRVDFAGPGPVLLVASAASLPFWEGECRLPLPLLLLRVSPDCCCCRCLMLALPP